MVGNPLVVHRNRGGILEVNLRVCFFYHFFDPDLRVETFFIKDETAENRGADFEIEDIGYSAHLYGRLRKI